MSLNEKINITIMLMLAFFAFAGFACKEHISEKVGDTIIKLAKNSFYAFLAYVFIMVFCEIWSR